MARKRSTPGRHKCPDCQLPTVGSKCPRCGWGFRSGRPAQRIYVGEDQPREGHDPSHGATNAQAATSE